MAAYISCPYDCSHKDTARNVFVELNNAGVKTFYNGDIPEDLRIELAGTLAAAIEKSLVFIPILCQQYGQGRNLDRNELVYATSREQVLIPVVVDPDYMGVPPGGLFTGTRLTDVSTPAKWTAELPQLIETIRAILPDPNICSGRASGSAAGDQGGVTAGSAADHQYA